MRAAATATTAMQCWEVGHTPQADTQPKQNDFQPASAVAVMEGLRFLGVR